MTKWLLLIALLALSACDQLKGPIPNQEVRERIFFACLEHVPKGPEKTQYNNWWFTVRHSGKEVLETGMLEVAIERYNAI